MHKLNEITEGFAKSFGQRAIVMMATGVTRLEGKTFEQMICEIYDVPWKGSNEGIIDVRVEDVGLSVKSLTFRFPFRKKGKGDFKTFRTVIGRCSPDAHDQHIERDKTPAAEAGRIVIEIWNERLAKARRICSDVRTFTILKSSDLTQWLLFEYEPKEFNSQHFSWAWEDSKRKKVKTRNLHGTNGLITLTWQPHGSHFSLTQPIPAQNTRFMLRRPPVIPAAEILRQIGFQDNWIAVKVQS